MSEYRLLACGSRCYPYPRVVRAGLDHLHRQHGDSLVVIEGACRGADMAAHDWCRMRRLPASRHRCFPVDWREARATRADWKRAGNERNTRMLRQHPDQVIAFHESFEYHRGGTSDMVLKALLTGVPVWIIPGADLTAGFAPSLDSFPGRRIQQARRELADLLLV